jgi:hypothetical protein
MDDLPTPSPRLRAVQRWACDLGAAGSLSCMAWQADWSDLQAWAGFFAFALWVASPFVALRLLGRRMRRSFPLLAGLSVLAALLLPAAYWTSFLPGRITSTSALVFVALPAVQWVAQGVALAAGYVAWRLVKRQ